MTKQIRKFENMGRTIRRYYVDQFYAINVTNITSGSTVLDLGGNKIKKRGQFNLDEYEFNTIYANLSLDKTPDIQIRAEYIPIKNDHFDHLDLIIIFKRGNSFVVTRILNISLH